MNAERGHKLHRDREGRALWRKHMGNKRNNMRAELLDISELMGCLKSLYKYGRIWGKMNAGNVWELFTQ